MSGGLLVPAEFADDVRMLIREGAEEQRRFHEARRARAERYEAARREWRRHHGHGVSRSRG